MYIECNWLEPFLCPFLNGSNTFGYNLWKGWLEFCKFKDFFLINYYVQHKILDKKLRDSKIKFRQSLLAWCKNTKIQNWS